MKHYKFTFDSKYSVLKNDRYIVVGTVSSGNLEVMIEAEKIESNKVCFDIITSVDGFKSIWKAVAKDIAEELKIGGLLFSINDFGAVPAVVKLRLRQAAEEYNL